MERNPLEKLSCWVFGHNYCPTVLPARNEHVDIDSETWQWGIRRECVHCGQRDDRPIKDGSMVEEP